PVLVKFFCRRRALARSVILPPGTRSDSPKKKPQMKSGVSGEGQPAPKLEKSPPLITRAGGLLGCVRAPSSLLPPKAQPPDPSHRTMARAGEAPASAASTTATRVRTRSATTDPSLRTAKTHPGDP